MKADGKKLVNGEGREILLRGVGFGSWMLPDGYMWRRSLCGKGARITKIGMRVLFVCSKTTTSLGIFGLGKRWIQTIRHVRSICQQNDSCWSITWRVECHTKLS